MCETVELDSDNDGLRDPQIGVHTVVEFQNVLPVRARNISVHIGEIDPSDRLAKLCRTSYTEERIRESRHIPAPDFLNPERL